MMRFCDSFSHYTTLLQKYGATSGSASISSSNGRFSGDALLLSYSVAHASGVRKTLDQQQTWIIGCAVKPGTIANGPQVFWSMMDGTSCQLELRVDVNGHLVLTRGASGTILATGTKVLSGGVWYYIELKAKIASGTSGTYEVHIDGVSEFSSGAANTQSTGNAYADGFQFGRFDDWANVSANPLFSDFYVADTQSGQVTDFLGDVRVQYRAPNGNGNSSQFTGSDGNSTDNYLLVDEHPPNDDTDYVEDSTVGHKDTYTFEDLSSTSGSVYAVQIGQYAKKTDAGTRKIQSIARLSGTEVNSADEVLSASYQYFFDIRETKPGGGVWTVTDVNNAEFGPYVSA
jgi:hypothetical protein